MSSYPQGADPQGYGQQSRPMTQYNHTDRPSLYRTAPQARAAPNTATYGRPPFNPQFQRTVHSPHNALPRGAGNAPPPPGPGYAPQPAQVQAQAISSRIASTNAAISAIQSVTPPVIRPVPKNRPIMSLSGLPDLPGGDLKGTIKFDHENSVEVVDEVTAQKSAAEFSRFTGNQRRERNKKWESYWKYRQNVNRQILYEVNECFKEAQEDANDFEESDDEDGPRRSRPIVVPYIYHNIGSLDIPRPPSVVMPDPEMITLRLQAQQSVRAQQQAQQAQQAQQIQVMQAQQISARQRAAQQIKQYGRSY